MHMGAFEYYDFYRRYQLHCNKLDNLPIDVPNHQAYSPIKPKIAQAKQYKRNKRLQNIQQQNDKIMHKLIKIGNRKPQTSSTPNLSLPPIKKQYTIPQYEQQNNIIAKKIIKSKASISSFQQAKKYRSSQRISKNIRQYQSSNGVIKNRKQHLAELFIMKKMKQSLIRGSNDVE